MAIHLIITGLSYFIQSEKLSEYLEISVHLLNFAVLLSYPINFFIYCRMSRAFRDAFTQLLCPSINQSTQEPVQTNPSPLLAKTHQNNNNNSNSHYQLELSNNNLASKTADIENRPSSTVILSATTAQTLVSLSPSNSPRHSNNDEKTSSIVSVGKQRVLFRDDVTPSTNRRCTDL